MPASTARAAAAFLSSAALVAVASSARSSWARASASRRRASLSCSPGCAQRGGDSRLALEQRSHWYAREVDAIRAHVREHRRRLPPQLCELGFTKLADAGVVAGPGVDRTGQGV